MRWDRHTDPRIHRYTDITTTRLNRPQNQFSENLKILKLWIRALGAPLPHTILELFIKVVNGVGKLKSNGEH